MINCREISDRKDAELQLFRSEARFRALVQGVSDVVAIIDGQGRFTFVSPAVTPMLGFRPEELVGSRWTDLISAEELEAVMAQQPGLVANEPVGPATAEPRGAPAGGGRRLAHGRRHDHRPARRARRRTASCSTPVT